MDLTTGDQTFASNTLVTFKCRRPGASTFIEFIGPAVSRAELNGEVLPANAFDGGRLQLEGLAADNVLTVSATASYMRDGTGMHRFQDPVDECIYLHSQFAEYSAHRVLTCFDQPDLKATFSFQVKSPPDWVVIANTPGARDDGGKWSFPTTKVMSTYLGAIVAGHYHSVHQDHRDIPLGIYCRRSLAQYLDADEIFEITRQGLDFFEQRFGYPYPFGKYDQLFVPEFSAGAMENVGCVTHNEYMVHRSKVTEAEHLERAEIILHEMSHMWFGDLVTMRWWDDTWLNESFATYMSYLAMADATRFTNAWTDFATRMKAAAKAQDQLPTTHPIAADIPDVEAMHLNFDRITYEKGAAVLKQLAAWVGEDAFFRGVAAYFKRHEYGNTELADFLAALEEASGRDLKSWSHVWLERAGVNTLSATVDMRGDSIKTVTLTQEAPTLHPTLRPHRLRVGLFDVKSSHVQRRRAVEVDVEGARTDVPELSDERAADLILVNDGDLTYTKIKLDPRSLETLKHHLLGLDDPLARALAWSALWDMARDAQLRARDYVEISIANIDVETDAAIVESLLGRMLSAITAYVAPVDRAALRSSLARASKERLSRTAAGTDLQLLWINTFIRAARKTDEVAWVRGLLDGSTKLDGLDVDFAIRWRAVKALAAIGAVDEDLIVAELHRDPTDEGQRAAATARAARPDPAAKAAAWLAVTGHRTYSLPMKRAFASGFHRADQEALLSAYVQPYFDSLLSIWASHSVEEALLFVRGMYPAMVVTQDVVDLTDGWLGRDLPGPIRRCLLEAQDETKRALRARAFDAS